MDRYLLWVTGQFDPVDYWRYLAANLVRTTPRHEQFVVGTIGWLERSVYQDHLTRLENRIRGQPFVGDRLGIRSFT